MLVDIEAPPSRARGLDHKSRKDVDQRRLARAIGTQQPENLAARNVEADMVERALGRRALADIGLGEGVDPDGNIGR